MQGSDLNTVSLSGILDGQPKINTIKNDMKSVSFSLAVKRTIVDQNEQTRVLTSWVSMVSYNNAIVDLSSKLKVGDRITAQGVLSVRSWKDEQGKKHTKYEVNIDKMSKEDAVEGEDFNHMVLSGTLDDQPVARVTSNDKEVISCSVSTSRRMSDKERPGEFKDLQSWYSISSYDPEVIQYLSSCAKGDRIIANGSLNIRSWSDATGEKKIRYELSAEKIHKISGASAISSVFGDSYEGSDSDSELDDSIFG